MPEFRPPKGMYYNTLLKKCVYKTPRLKPEEENMVLVPECDPDFHYDPETGFCIKGDDPKLPRFVPEEQSRLFKNEYHGFEATNPGHAKGIKTLNSASSELVTQRISLFELKSAMYSIRNMVESSLVALNEPGRDIRELTTKFNTIIEKIQELDKDMNNLAGKINVFAIKHQNPLESFK